MNLILFLIFGSAAGLIARMLMPQSHPLSVTGTMILGVAGSFVGGFSRASRSGYPAMNFHSMAPASVIGSMLILFVADAYAPRRPRFSHR